jgi:hypothetical protein
MEKPKTNNTIYRKDLLRDWSTPLLLNYGWYLDCSKENTLSSKFEIWEKYEFEFLQGLGALEKETPTKKRMEGGQEEGKKIDFRVRMQNKEDVPTESQKEAKLGLGRFVFLKSSSNFHSDHPN